MSQDTWPDGSYADFADLAGRREALRHAAAMPGADPRALLDAAFAELDAAIDALTKLAESEPARRIRPGGPARLAQRGKRPAAGGVPERARALVRARARRHDTAGERARRVT